MKRIFAVLSLLAVFHVCALGGLAGYSYSRGWLARDRVMRAAAILRGDEPPEGAAVADDAPTSRPAAQIEPARRSEVDEQVRIELDRRNREIQNAWSMLELQQLSLLREKESFEEGRKQLAETEKRKAMLASDGGLHREMEILEGLKPKDAKELLQQKPETDVVRLLMTMDVRTARKIVSQFRSTEERQWIGRILEKLHERDAAQAEVLGAGT